MKNLICVFILLLAVSFVKAGTNSVIPFPKADNLSELNPANKLKGKTEYKAKMLLKKNSDNTFSFQIVNYGAGNYPPNSFEVGISSNSGIVYDGYPGVGTLITIPEESESYGIYVTNYPDYSGAHGTISLSVLDSNNNVIASNSGSNYATLGATFGLNDGVTLMISFTQ